MTPAQIAEQEDAIRRLTNEIADEKNSWFSIDQANLSRLYLNRAVAKEKLGRLDEAIQDDDEALRNQPDNALAKSNRAIHHTQRGGNYLNAGNNQAAFDDYNKAIQDNATNADYFVNRGVASERLGNYDEAIKDYTEAIRLKPGYPLAKNNRAVAFDKRGNIHLNAGNNQAAFDDYNRAIQDNATNADYFVNRGAANQRLGNYPVAIQDYTEALRLKPGYPLAKNNRAVAFDKRGNIHLNAGNNQAAFDDYNRAIQDNATNADYFVNRGAANQRLGNYPVAIQDYTEALRLKPDYALARNNRALTYHLFGKNYLGAGNNQAALENFNKAIQNNATDAGYFADRGVANQRLGNSDRALQDYAEALRLNPNHAVAKSNRALIYYQRGKNHLNAGNNNEALLDFTRAIQDDATNAEYFFERGVAHNGLKNYDDSVRNFNDALRLNPGHVAAKKHRASAYNMQGLNHVSTGNHTQAVNDFTEAIADHGAEPIFLFNRGVSNHALKKYDEAIRDFNEAVRLNPEYISAKQQRAGAYNWRGFNSSNAKNYAAAITDFTAAIADNPAESNFFFNRGVSHNGLNQYDDAIRDFSEALRLKPDYAIAKTNLAANYFQRGKNHLTTGNNEGALADFNNAIQNDGNNADYFANCGVANERFGNTDRALQDYAEALRLNPNHALAKSNRALIYYQRGKNHLNVGNNNEALQDFTKAIQDDATKADYFVDRALVNEKLGKPNEAIQDYTAALQINPNHAVAKNNRAILYHQRGTQLFIAKSYEAALVDFDNAIKDNATVPDYHVYHGSANYKLGKLDAAIEDFTAVLRLNVNHPIVKSYRAASFHQRGNNHLNTQNNEAALADFNSAIKDNATNPAFFSSRSIANGKLGNFEAAIQDATEALHLDPNHAVAKSTLAAVYHLRGKQHLNAGNNNEALQDFTRAIQYDATKPNYFINRAIAHEKLRLLNNAIEDYVEALRLKPDNPSAKRNLAALYHQRGRNYLAAGDNASALWDFISANEEDATIADYHVDRGIAHAKLEQLDEAIKSFDEALRLDPESATAKNYRAIAYSNRGNKFLIAFNSAAALEDFNKAIQDDDSNPDFFVGLSRAYVGQTRYKKATDCCDEALRLNPSHIDAKKQRAIAYCKRGEKRLKKDTYLGAKAAIWKFDKAISDDPTNPDCYHGRGMAHERIGSHAAAITDFNKALELKENHALVKQKRAIAHYEQGKSHLNRNTAVAIQDFTLAIADDDKNADFYANRGLAHEKQKHFNDSISDYETALRLAPHHPLATKNLSKVYRLRGKNNYDRNDDLATIADCTRAIDENKDDGEAYTCRGLAYQRLKKFDGAIEDLSKAIVLKHNTIANTNNRGACFRERGEFFYSEEKYESAINDCNSALDDNSKDSKAFDLRGRAYTKIDKYFDAINDFTQALKLNPQYISAQNSRGVAYRLWGLQQHNLKKYGIAIAKYDLALQDNPVDVEAFYQRGCSYLENNNPIAALDDFSSAEKFGYAMDKSKLALAYFECGKINFTKLDYVAALKNFDAAILNDDTNADFFLGRGRVYDKQGNFNNAIRDYTKAIELNVELLAPTYNYRANANENKGDSLTEEDQKADQKECYEQAEKDYKKALEINARLSKDNLARIQQKLNVLKATQTVKDSLLAILSKESAIPAPTEEALATLFATLENLYRECQPLFMKHAAEESVRAEREKIAAIPSAAAFYHKTEARFGPLLFASSLAETGKLQQASTFKQTAAHAVVSVALASHLTHAEPLVSFFIDTVQESQRSTRHERVEERIGGLESCMVTAELAARKLTLKHYEAFADEKSEMPGPNVELAKTLGEYAAQTMHHNLKQKDFNNTHNPDVVGVLVDSIATFESLFTFLRNAKAIGHKITHGLKQAIFGDSDAKSDSPSIPEPAPINLRSNVAVPVSLTRQEHLHLENVRGVAEEAMAKTAISKKRMSILEQELEEQKREIAKLKAIVSDQSQSLSSSMDNESNAPSRRAPSPSMENYAAAKRSSPVSSRPASPSLPLPTLRGKQPPVEEETISPSSSKSPSRAAVPA